ncbi:MAG: metal-dependent transcriptional regulator [Clostridia bacterium]|nr:metal-dependent transcriptional regulator [Clostridia bacterium]
MRINESSENYLETILVLKNKKGSVRSIDVANELGFTKASVSVAMKRFVEDGFVVRDESGNLTLTPKGIEVAEKVYERHKVLSELFITIGVDEETALEDSCRIEHCLSDITFEKIKEHIEVFRDLKK